MLVQCPECSTKYDLDEDKLDHGGTKVRCKRCQHVFTAFRPMSSADILLDDPVPMAAYFGVLKPFLEKHELIPCIRPGRRTCGSGSAYLYSLSVIFHLGK